MNGTSIPRPIHVSMAVDRGFEVPLAVSLLSLAEAHDAAGVACDVSILYHGLSTNDRSAIDDEVAGRLGLEWLSVDLNRLSGANYTVGLTRAALFRLILPELLPERDRTIYLDADTIVRHALNTIWSTKLSGDELLAAVRDAGSPFAAGPSGTDWRALGLPPQSPYFNSGLMVLALDQWRAEGTAREALAILRAHDPRWGDQDALNLVAKSRWQELPRRWNVQTADAEGRSLSWALWRDDVEAAVADPGVIHFTESVKPWNGKIDHPFGALWHDTLGRTKWVGWSPRKLTAADRIRGRLSRAAKVLLHG